VNRCSIALIVIALAGLQGCSRLSTEYGKSKGIGARTSLNGFAALRAAFEQAGFRTRDVSRLSDRVRRSDVIVWTPKILGPVDDNVTNWFDSWLQQGSRTLVYVIPDSGSEVDYWADAMKLAPPEQRLEYRKRAGQAINQRMQWRLNRAPVPSNGWFEVEPRKDARSVRPIAGQWLTDIQQPSGDADGSQDPTFGAIEYALRPFDAAKSAAGATAAGSTTSGPTSTTVSFVPTGPSTSIWLTPVTTTPTEVAVEYVPLLSIDDQGDMVAEVRSDTWLDSRIVVVAGGSLLTNYAFTRPANQRLADRIIAAAQPSGTTSSGTPSSGKDEPVVGFLTSDWGNVPVSERQADTPQSTGMEFLTEWPISIVTMHGVVLGVLVCLMLIPIFGRPKRLRQVAANSFGHHLDAVAALMNRAGGEAYARERISDYRKRMHGETSGPWVLADRDPPQPSPPLSKLGPDKTVAIQRPSPAANI
jgi:hypothetical protein